MYQCNEDIIRCLADTQRSWSIFKCLGSTAVSEKVEKKQWAFILLTSNAFLLSTIINLAIVYKNQDDGESSLPHLLQMAEKLPGFNPFIVGEMRQLLRSLITERNIVLNVRNKVMAHKDLRRDNEKIMGELTYEAVNKLLDVAFRIVTRVGELSPKKLGIFTQKICIEEGRECGKGWLAALDRGTLD